MRLNRLFWSGLLFCLLFLVLGDVCLAKSDAEALKSLVAGVKHNSSLLRSGKGQFTVKYDLTKFGEEVLDKTKAGTDESKDFFFAFDKGKVYLEFLSGSLRGLVLIFDGEKQVEIYKWAEPYRIGVRGNFKALDPRGDFHYWEAMFKGKPIAEYLEENAVSILGDETINNTLCYIVQAKRYRTGTVKFWIAPSKGYRVLRREYETSYRGGYPAKIIMEIEYEELKDGIWFPKSGTDTTLALSKVTGKYEIMFKYTMTAKDFEVNVDTSDLFKLEIAPETMVWDYRANCKRTAREAGICPKDGK